MDKYAQKDKKNMCNNCKETNQPENPTAINAAVELKEASDAVKRKDGLFLTFGEW